MSGISILICANASASYLGEFLASFFLTNTHSPIEIIVFDCTWAQGRKKDQTTHSNEIKEIAASFATKGVVRYIRSSSACRLCHQTGITHSCLHSHAHKVRHPYLLAIDGKIDYAADKLPPALARLEANPELDSLPVHLNSRDFFLLRTARYQKLGKHQGPRTISQGSQAADIQIPDLYEHQLSTRRTPGADIIICVHNALEETRQCLSSLLNKTSHPYRLILINDGSNQETTLYLQRFAQEHPGTILLYNSEPQGYTKAANQGLKAASADYIILLNSDVLVTRCWLERIIECGESDPGIGIVGPLSNAASYQSVPRIWGDSGDWDLNPLPAGISIEHMAEAVFQLSSRAFPRAPFINGFCYAIKKEVLSRVGYLDEESFPMGYGEENDYSIRTRNAGYSLAIADHAYVYHYKSKSFSHSRRKELSRAGQQALKQKHSSSVIASDIELWQHMPSMHSLRNRLSALSSDSEALKALLSEREPKLLWLLDGPGGYGGTLSIVQEADCLRQLGWKSQVAVSAEHEQRLLQNYPHISPAAFVFHASQQELQKLAADYDIVVATHFPTIDTLQEILKVNPHLQPAYYIQDYEPWIINPESRKYLQNAKRAYLSYTKIESMLCFAKTEWLRQTVLNFHPGLKLYKVTPGLDTRIFSPSLDNVRQHSQYPVKIAAMVRPSTPRRSPRLTMQLLQRLKQQLQTQVEILLFGCSQDDPGFRSLPQDFRYQHLGRLSPSEIAETFSAVDIFVDMSVYQAFGRTGLEAMAMGCAVVLPEKGGAHEYGEHNTNCLFADTTDLDVVQEAVTRLVNDHGLRNSLAHSAVTTASRYGVLAAALSEAEVFRKCLKNPSPALASSHARSSEEQKDYCAHSPNSPLEPEIEFFTQKNTFLQEVDFNRPVSIVLPVYNALSDLQKCISSILYSTHSRYEVIVIDDCSTDQEISDYLQDLSQDMRFKILRNQTNLGFVASANKGLQAAKHDVLLLNSDTVLTPRWLMKILAAAYSSPDIATATPVSNAAGVFSVPEPNQSNPLPADVDLQGMHRMVERLSRHMYPEVPTGNGFCMYIKKKALQQVGYLDQATFGRGYGEENDLCLRLRELGWRHVLDDSTYIYHKSHASFGAEKDVLAAENFSALTARYPEYKKLIRIFRTSRQINSIRERIRIESQSAPRQTKPHQKRLLLLTGMGFSPESESSRPGRHKLPADSQCYLLASNGCSLHLSHHEAGQTSFLGSWGSTRPHTPWHQEFLRIYREVLFGLKIEEVRILDALPHTLDILTACQEMGAPVLFWVQDLYATDVCLQTQKANHDLADALQSQQLNSRSSSEPAWSGCQDYLQALLQAEPIRDLLQECYLDSPVSAGQKEPDTEPSVLYILHDGQGGVRHTTYDLAESISNYCAVFILFCNRQYWTLWQVQHRTKLPLLRFFFVQDWSVTGRMDQERLGALDTVLEECSPSLVHIRHFIGNEPEIVSRIKARGLPVVVSLHDLYALCPTIHMQNDQEQYCAGDCKSVSGPCNLNRKWSGKYEKPVLKDNLVYRHRKRFAWDLARADQVVTTSWSIKELICWLMPELQNTPFNVIEHGRDVSRKNLFQQPAPNAPIRVVSFGALGRCKGAELLKYLLQKNQDTGSRIEFHLLGTGLGADPQLSRHGAIGHGAYSREELSKHMESIKPSLALILSTWPETYCHTLTEAWAMGLPVLATDIGALGERLRAHGGGWLVDYQNPESCWAKLQQVVSDTEVLRETAQQVSRIPIRSRQEMAEEYVQLYQKYFPIPCVMKNMSTKVTETLDMISRKKNNKLIRHDNLKAQKPEILFIHVGAGKTGTSALQSFFYANRDKLKNAGVYFPKAGLRVDNEMIDHHRLSDHGAFAEGNALDLWRAIQQQRLGKAVVTSEYLHNKLSTPGGQLFFENIRDIFETKQVRIIFYIRRYSQWLQSVYAQFVKNGKLSSEFNEFARKHTKNPIKQLFLLADIFGDKNIIVKPYEKKQFYGGDIFRDFCHLINIPWDDSFVLPKDNKNPSLTLEALELKRRLNKLEIDPESHKIINMKLHSFSSQNMGNKIYKFHNIISYKEQLEIEKQFESKYQEIARRFMGRSDGELFKDKYLDNLPTKKNIETSDIDVDAPLCFLVSELCQNIQQLKKKIKDEYEDIKKTAQQAPRIPIRSKQETAEEYLSLYQEHVRLGYQQEKKAEAKNC
ncbi:MAG: glycosyltransferase, partial [Desulfohalobiaceae bacterium]